MSDYQHKMDYDPKVKALVDDFLAGYVNHEQLRELLESFTKLDLVTIDDIVDAACDMCDSGVFRVLPDQWQIGDREIAEELAQQLRFNLMMKGLRGVDANQAVKLVCSLRNEVAGLLDHIPTNL